MVRFLLSCGLDPCEVATSPTGKSSNAMSFAIENGAREIGKDFADAGFSADSISSQKGGGVSFCDDLKRYIENRFGKSEADAVICSPDGSIHVLRISPSEAHPFYTLFSLGLSNFTTVPDDPDIGFTNVEILAFFPMDWKGGIEKDDYESIWPVLMMIQIAVYAKSNWLGGTPTLHSR